MQNLVIWMYLLHWILPSCETSFTNHSNAIKKLFDDVKTCALINGTVSSDNKNYPVIPKILHQSWKNNDISTHSTDAVKCHSFVRKYAPDFLHLLWTDVDILALISTHYPQYLSYFQQLNMNIKRADFSRYLILLQYGGLYMDLDIELRRPVSQLLYPNRTSLSDVRLEFVSYVSHEFEQSGVPFAGNAFFAAVADSPILRAMVNHTIHFEKQRVRATNDVLAHSGPIGLGVQVRNHIEKMKLNSSASSLAADLSRIVILGSDVVGNVEDRPSHAVHRRKHKW